MSYEYLLFRSAPNVDPQTAVDDGVFEALGTPGELSAAISRVFPSLQWKASRVNAAVVTGGPAPSFLLNAEADGQVHSFTMSRASASQTSELLIALGLSAVDMESGEIAEL
ncbi:MAG: hypothetical protein V4628_17340 [Pseudomonadota bacterium]